jgi:predicted ArsR family transcriptional regulator
MQTYVIHRLEQARLLCDPFKLRLLEQFANAPVTTKQVADRIGEKAPRLYRHVDALADEGLLQLIEERPKRGTVERYYQSVAERFEVAPDLFSTPATDDESAFQLIRSVLQETESELQFVSDHQADLAPDEERHALFLRLTVTARPEDLEVLQQKLMVWLEEANAANIDDEDADNLETYAGLLAFYPRISK